MGFQGQRDCRCWPSSVVVGGQTRTVGLWAPCGHLVGLVHESSADDWLWRLKCVYLSYISACAGQGIVAADAGIKVLCRVRVGSALLVLPFTDAICSLDKEATNCRQLGRFSLSLLHLPLALSFLASSPSVKLCNLGTFPYPTRPLSLRPAGRPRRAQLGNSTLSSPVSPLRAASLAARSLRNTHLLFFSSPPRRRFTYAIRRHPIGLRG